MAIYKTLPPESATRQKDSPYLVEMETVLLAMLYDVTRQIAVAQSGKKLGKDKMIVPNFTKAKRDSDLAWAEAREKWVARRATFKKQADS